MWLNTGVQDIRFSEESIQAGKNLPTKFGIAPDLSK